jgi:hypothetical protein
MRMLEQKLCSLETYRIFDLVTVRERCPEFRTPCPGHADIKAVRTRSSSLFP